MALSLLYCTLIGRTLAFSHYYDALLRRENINYAYLVVYYKFIWLALLLLLMYQVSVQ